MDSLQALEAQLGQDIQQTQQEPAQGHDHQGLSHTLPEVARGEAEAQERRAVERQSETQQAQWALAWQLCGPPPSREVTEQRILDKLVSARVESAANPKIRGMATRKAIHR